MLTNKKKAKELKKQIKKRAKRLKITGFAYFGKDKTTDSLKELESINESLNIIEQAEQGKIKTIEKELKVDNK